MAGTGVDLLLLRNPHGGGEGRTTECTGDWSDNSDSGGEGCTTEWTGDWSDNSDKWKQYPQVKKNELWLYA